MKLRRNIVVGALVVLSVFAMSASADASNNKTVTVNGCRADLYSATSVGATDDVKRSYSETYRTNSASCSLATYNKYRYSGSTVVYTTSTDWDGSWATKDGPKNTYLTRSYHFVNLNGPFTGTWYNLP